MTKLCVVFSGRCKSQKIRFSIKNRFLSIFFAIVKMCIHRLRPARPKAHTYCTLTRQIITYNWNGCMQIWLYWIDPWTAVANILNIVPICLRKNTSDSNWMNLVRNFYRIQIFIYLIHDDKCCFAATFNVLHHQVNAIRNASMENVFFIRQIDLIGIGFITFLFEFRFKLIDRFHAIFGCRKNAAESNDFITRIPRLIAFF